MPVIQRALISVSDKTGVVEFARALRVFGVEILSTGGTAKLLTKSNISVVDVAAYTGFAEMLEGRVKTLHPKIHAGILHRRDCNDHVETLVNHGMSPIDLVVVNLYPFEQVTARNDCVLAEAIENIDIGGPTLLRAAAKNHAFVTVVVDHADFARVLAQMEQNHGSTDDALRFDLALKAFEHTAAYDGAIANYLGACEERGRARFPRTFNLQLRRELTLRYGENPHQPAAFYVEADAAAGTVSRARQLQGKELSFNNIADSDAALECVKTLAGPACVIVKHANPCGVAVAESVLDAYERAYATDPVSAFGGIIAFNRTFDAATAEAILARQFVEVIVAPTVATEAAAVLAEKPNIRVIECGAWDETRLGGHDCKRVRGGLLVQESDDISVNEADLKVVTRRRPTPTELRDLLFSWRVVKFVKSNAIVYCRDNRTIGVGAGQMSRIDSARIAALKAADAGLDVRGSVMASDAFFPFRDGLDQAAQAGVTAVIQPGGSMRDQEVIDAANEHGIAMVFTGIRHFRH